MKDGYYYFIPASAGKKDADKSLGYLCVTKYPRRASYSIQCSLSQETAANLGGQGTIEIFVSPATYITAQSILVGKIYLAPKARLFIDSALSAASADAFEEDLYAIVTAGGRTICYAILQQKEAAAPLAETPEETQAPRQETPVQQMPQQQNPQPASPAAAPRRAPFQGKEFDPFDTTNASYQWYIYDNRTDSADSVKNIQELDKMLRYFNVQYDLFAKMNSVGNAPYSDTFLKMSYYAVQVAGHVLRGVYTDPESGRIFTVIGLPGWNTQSVGPGSATTSGRRNGHRRGRGAQQQATSGTTRTIRECSRWLAAKRKPPCSYNRNYNGYWLYYFDAESGMPVKAVMKSD